MNVFVLQFSTGELGATAGRDGVGVIVFARRGLAEKFLQEIAGDLRIVAIPRDELPVFLRSARIKVIEEYGVPSDSALDDSSEFDETTTNGLSTIVF